ncbi:uncharacterized protein LOC112588934 [Harpegnathos saltator]|uniref:uncharacterized protein LOC112588934 n=1 Tax=Harpegnathos saltator TaxID=610380 RepID=UPI000DBED1E6|nr:uncharacterized protein LOC112588934 [Harpegnathos saltator]
MEVGDTDVEMAVDDQPGPRRLGRREGLRSASRCDKEVAETPKYKLRSGTPSNKRRNESSSEDDYGSSEQNDRWEIPRKSDGDKAFQAQRKIFEEKKREEALLKGLEDPRKEFQDCSSNRKHRAELQRVTEHMEEVLFRDITASELEAATKVLGFSLRSKNLNGIHVKVLRDASTAIAAGATLMAQRMASSECGENHDILEELRAENMQLRTMQGEMTKRMEEMEKALRSIKEASPSKEISPSPPVQEKNVRSSRVAPPSMVVPSSPPSQGNKQRGIKGASSSTAIAPSPAVPVREKERTMGYRNRCIMPPSADLEEEEMSPVGWIDELQKGQIKQGKTHPVQYRKEVSRKGNKPGPTVREIVSLDVKVRLDKIAMRGQTKEETMEDKITSMVHKAMETWASQKDKAHPISNNDAQEENSQRKTRKGKKRTARKKNRNGRSGNLGSGCETQQKAQGEKKEEDRKKGIESGKEMGTTGTDNKKPRKPRRKVPSTAAVSITTEDGKYKEVLAEVKKKINIDNMGITKIKTRQGAMGALILEIPGEDKDTKADLLAAKLRKVLEGKARVNRPRKLGEIRLRGFEVSTTEEEVADCIAKEGGCSTAEAELQTGRIRTTAAGFRSLWARCPLMVAKKVAEEEQIPVGWTRMGWGPIGGSVAIVWKANEKSPPADILESGRHFVVIRWGTLIVVGVYLPPAKSLGLPSYGLA